jgi:Na+/melibiose symporter-like transporter
MIFFYELVFVVLAVAAVFIGETWSRTAAFVFMAGWFAIATLGYASFGARLALPGQLSTDEERRWFTDARDGLRHLRLLFGVAALAALAWRVIAG